MEMKLGISDYLRQVSSSRLNACATHLVEGCGGGAKLPSESVSA